MQPVHRAFRGCVGAAGAEQCTMYVSITLQSILARMKPPHVTYSNTLQDLGNTNFSIHVPRTTFDRGATAQVILRAVRALGVDADVNERNDICVGGEKASGSAYKIVSGRAYHHGTMLITTRLEMLGDLLRVDKVRF